MIVALVAFVAGLLLVAYLLGRASDGDDEPAAPETTTTEPATTTTPTTPTTPLATTTTSTTAPEAITSPVRLQGTSTAFEANVSVALYEDGSATPIGTGVVMGGSMGEPGPFDGELAFDEPGERFGVLVLFTESMEDGATWEASVLRVRFP